MKVFKKIKSGVSYIKGSIKKLKDEYWRARCDYIKYYETLPIRENVILLESQSATKADGSIFYILRYLKSSEKYADYKIYLSSWIRYKKKINALLDHFDIKGVNLVTYSSDEYVRLLASAKYLVNDVTFPAYFIKKEGQVYLNTWHGTPLKTLGRMIGDDIAIGNAQKNFVCADYLLYPNEFTKKVMIRDYMLENISSGSSVLCGYPRNEIFFDEISRTITRGRLNVTDKKVYAYMPTWRGTVANVGSAKNNTYLMYIIYSLDSILTDDEVLYVNFHPLAVQKKDEPEMKKLRHIKKFPEGYETYEMLNAADVLITDYSSVFFDFACTRRKIVLFPYDKEEYLETRGMYFDMDELPFPQVFDVPELIEELRSEKNYDDSEFVRKYNAYDCSDASRKLCDFVFLGEDTGLKTEKIPDNGKENVLLYAGNLDKNGITTSLRSLTNSIDLDKRNYYISFCQSKAKKNAFQIATFNPKLNFFAIAEIKDLTPSDRVKNKLFRMKLISAKRYAKIANTRIEQDFLRSYGGARFDAAVQFCGYEDNIILLYSAFKGRNAVFVHNDMINEKKTRGNQRIDLLKYAYNKYDRVVTVSDDIIPPTAKISGRSDNILTVKNVIDYRTILQRAEEPVTLDRTTKCSVSRDSFMSIMASEQKKFINVARFSPEKGHDRLVNAFSKFAAEYPASILIIMGGNSRDGGYEKLNEKIKSMGLQNNVILLLSVSNPYPIIKECDYFILSSLYEGFGLVLAEADILGKPVISTDITGPRTFMKKYGGTLVESSEAGIYKGLKMLYNNEVKIMNVDYDAYNKECVDAFEKIFE